MLTLFYIFLLIVFALLLLTVKGTLRMRNRIKHSANALLHFYKTNEPEKINWSYLPSFQSYCCQALAVLPANLPQILFSIKDQPIRYAKIAKQTMSTLSKLREKSFSVYGKLSREESLNIAVSINTLPYLEICWQFQNFLKDGDITSAPELLKLSEKRSTQLENIAGRINVLMSLGEKDVDSFNVYALEEKDFQFFRKLNENSEFSLTEIHEQIYTLFCILDAYLRLNYIQKSHIEHQYQEQLT